MFASQVYPDITFGVGTDKQIADAAAGDAVYALNDYLEEYAPNWHNYLTENADVRKSITYSDGNIYSLPMVRDEEYNYSLRDQWLIEKSWLDELGLQMPTTVEEFYNVLKAFKANAGKGTIPKDVIPYYIYGITNDVGGALDFINSFGVGVVRSGYMVTVNEKGQVECNYADKSIIEPINWLNRFVNEDLIPKECFTDSFDTYLTKIKSTTTTIGSYHAYTNRDLTMSKTVAMAPLDSGNGEEPVIRSQSNVVTKNHFTVYKTCKYPEIAVRLANMMAEEDWSVQASYGMIGGEETTVTKDESGKYIIDDGNGEYAGLYVPGERVAYLISEDLHKKVVLTETSKNYSRSWAVNNVYKDYSMDIDTLYPTFVMSEKNADRLAELELDIYSHISKTLSKWVMNGGAEKGWDEYIKQLNNFGLEEYLEILQEELDAYNAR